MVVEDLYLDTALEEKNTQPKLVGSECRVGAYFGCFARFARLPY